jgi:hypothetical protein
LSLDNPRITTRRKEKQNQQEKARGALGHNTQQQTEPEKNKYIDATVAYREINSVAKHLPVGRPLINKEG